ncbi:tetratricopeptide repeat protein [Novacetimonas pomaceti]|uniref:Sel1 repeat family protein n=1 Tax=Novacetimonas pomaceti TaxID=2021998 RepID=A0A318QU42_9PROT|nr:tetratricopeptide repeat protein [Novacetimonas pomaceti]PYD76223.1 hypothetical protein CFR71_05065 [Novacetimonas pomaceti]
MKISRLFDRFFTGIAPEAAYARACHLLERGEHARGFAMLGQMARDGMPQAQFRVAQAYLDGTGTPLSISEGARWLRHAAEAGHAQSCFTLGVLMLLDIPCIDDPAAAVLPGSCGPDAAAPHDPVAATRWVGRAAEAGLVEAQALYGYLLANGPEEVRDDAAARHWSTIAAGAGCAQGYLGLGLARLETDTAAAISALRHAAQEGLGSACYVLGMLHESGRGGEVDLGAAARMYALAAEQDIRPACARYGMALLRGRGVARDIMRAETWLRRAGLRGDLEAALVVGDLHARGLAEMASDHEAVSWYRRAAMGGHADGCRMMALMCMAGRGIPAPDPHAAAHWLRQAAACGDDAALTDLAAILDRNAEHPAPDADARAGTEQRTLADGFARAARNGDPVGAFNYAKCLLDGFGRAPDPAQAARWMHEAARAGVVNAQYWYGRMLLRGQGVTADPAMARQWIDDAARSGMADAQVAAAQMRITGVGGTRDHAGALSLYHLAADQDHVDAMFSLGAMYGGGHEVPPDRRQAQQWFEKAAGRGNALAQLMMGRYLGRGLAGVTDIAAARNWLRRAQAQGVAQAGEELGRLPPMAPAAAEGMHAAT